MELYNYSRGKGTPILLIHGIMSDSSFFEELSNLLSKEYQVICYDRCGYGKNELCSDIDYSLETQVEDAVRIIRMHTNEPVCIYGNSAGGLIALEISMKYPDLVRNMVLLEPSIGLSEGEKTKLKEWNQELRGYRDANRIKKALPAFARVIGENQDKAPVNLDEIRKAYHNLEAFMRGELDYIQNYSRTVEELKSVKKPIKIAITENGKDSIFATSSIEAAKMLDWEIVYFPGNHNAAKNNAREVAEVLRKCFEKS